MSDQEKDAKELAKFISDKLQDMLEKRDMDIRSVAVGLSAPVVQTFAFMLKEKGPEGANAFMDYFIGSLQHTMQGIVKPPKLILPGDSNK